MCHTPQSSCSESVRDSMRQLLAGGLATAEDLMDFGFSPQDVEAVVSALLLGGGKADPATAREDDGDEEEATHRPAGAASSSSVLQFSPTTAGLRVVSPLTPVRSVCRRAGPPLITLNKRKRAFSEENASPGDQHDAATHLSLRLNPLEDDGLEEEEEEEAIHRAGTPSQTTISSERSPPTREERADGVPPATKRRAAGDPPVRCTTPQETSGTHGRSSLGTPEGDGMLTTTGSLSSAITTPSPHPPLLPSETETTAAPAAASPLSSSAVAYWQRYGNGKDSNALPRVNSALWFSGTDYVAIGEFF